MKTRLPYVVILCCITFFTAKKKSLMKQFILVIISIILISCNREKKEDLNYVLSKFYENANRINNVEYHMQRIDTFPEDGEVWNNKGFAYVEKDINDTIFGISFYSRRFDVDKLHIYKNSIGYEFIENKKEFNNEKGAIGFLGKPGGQMVSREIFKLDTVYSNLKLTTKKNSYVLNYTYKNDTLYNIKNITKTIRLRKTDFFPIEIIKKSNVMGNKSSTQLFFSKIKINKGTELTIDSLISSKINIYAETNNRQEKKESLIGKKLSNFTLPNLVNNQIIDFKVSKVTLIDFWETWCGPCMTSLPKIERLRKKYSNSVQIIGIISQDTSNALQLLRKKNITFLNLIGNPKILEKYGVNSFPRYILTNNDGVIIAEYFGFSEKIENDIKGLIDKK